MIDHIWTVICRNAVVDKRTNNASLLNTLEQITVHDEPKPDAMIGLEFDVVTLWIRTEPKTPSRGVQRIVVVDPTGQEIGAIEQEIDLGAFERSRNILHFQGLPVRMPGRHSFRIELREEGETDWRFIDEVPLSITFAPPAVENPIQNEPLSAQT